ncbi:MAG: DUF1816 domain-containing protein [Leptolyngbyaceae bacterium]|nr:DUF1816 domain-containing protein [Leptolyngbyaceae bacterium]
MKEVLTSFLDTLGLAWWVEITTAKPDCKYYFGPFSSAKEAKSAQPGYVEDLQQEGAQGIEMNVKRCKPERITISNEADDWTREETSKVISRRF